MRVTNIYQTLEDRGNYDEIEDHGPYFCSLRDAEGRLKKGSKQPWLGEGYYFWDTRISDAQWWGGVAYGKFLKGYVICHTSYDQNSPYLYDMVGSVAMFDDFVECAEIIKSKRGLNRVSFPMVLQYLKKNKEFNYRAIRVRPVPESQVTDTRIDVFFPGNMAGISSEGRIQICFFDKSLLNQPFKVVEKHPFLV